MYQDSSIFYASINFPVYPLKNNVEFPAAKPMDSMVEFGDKSLITDEMAGIVGQLGMEIDYLILWSWNHFSEKESHYRIHSDGHIDNNSRGCAINWVLDGDSHVEWYSFKGGKPLLTTKSGREDDAFTITEWHYDSAPVPLAAWKGCGPTLLNIKQPHGVVLSGRTTRKTITMRLTPNIPIEGMVLRLGKFLKSINR